MPFGNPLKDPENAKKLNTIYEKYIKLTIEETVFGKDISIICHRADKEYRSGEIITHIIENLVNSDIVIADLSGRNPNVFYELGVRHSVMNNTILISEEIEDIPFDLRHLRTISYKYTPDKMMDFKEELKKNITNIVENPNKIDNPIRRYLYDIETEKIITNPTPPGFDIIKDLAIEIQDLKKFVTQQTMDTKQLVESILFNSPVKGENETKITLDFFEGAWFSKENSSHYYPKIVNNELFIPYCYSGDECLVGHYYNCKLFNNLLAMQFKWLDRSISGFSFLQIIDDNTLRGGWWYADELPTNTTVDNLMILKVEQMKKYEWKRLINKQIPDWAQEYFKTNHFKTKTI
jgi:hypothetical protein